MEYFSLRTLRFVFMGFVVYLQLDRTREWKYLKGSCHRQYLLFVFEYPVVDF